MEFEKTVLVELLNDKAMERLQELEQLKFINIVSVTTTHDKHILTDTLKDTLSKNAIHNLDNQIIETKSEWKTRLEDLETTNL